PYPWPHDASLSPTTTALLLIDMQRDLLSSQGYLSTSGTLPPDTLARFQSLVPRLVSLLSTFRHAGFGVWHTRMGFRESGGSTAWARERYPQRRGGIIIGAQGPLGPFLVRGSRGHDLISELLPLPHEPVVDKPGYGAFTYTDLEATLRARGLRNLVVCGIALEGAVSSTVREAADRGFDVLVVED
ncbi:Isochorismatase hydrolase, partial [Westerdykella ornata]